MKHVCPLFFCLFLVGQLMAQDMPYMMHLSDDGHRLVTGGEPPKSLYTLDEVKKIELWFEVPTFWDSLLFYHDDVVDQPATLIYDGDTLPAPVGVRFKGTSTYYFNDSDKKSFDISLNSVDSDQDINGYNSLNLNCGFTDVSFIRECVYENTIQRYVPALSVNYVELYLNGVYWGIYSNVEQLNKDFLKEWFLSNDGTNWRAKKNTAGGGTGGLFGTGYSSLNYLGEDTTIYTHVYTLNSTEKTNPWTDLITTCRELNPTGGGIIEDTISNYLDLDRTLWFLACENIFEDEDSYVFKGGMDYYIYWDPETKRLTPLEYDGNNAFYFAYNTMGPLYNANDEEFPLLHVLMRNNSIYQRYLAHMRTILSETFKSAVLDPKIDYVASIVDSFIQVDPKKIYDYPTYLAGVASLKTFTADRNIFLNSDTGIAHVGPAISETLWKRAGISWGIPTDTDTVIINTTVVESSGSASANLFYATGLTGKFSVLPMFDDGLHNDSLSNDGIFGAEIPSFPAETDVRFYIEAVNEIGTVTFDPPGAEHDIYYYKVVEPTVPLSLTSPLIAAQFHLFPNPAGDELHVVSENAGEHLAIVYDVLGNKITSFVFNGTSSLHTANWKRGIYFIVLDGAAEKVVLN